MLLPLILSSTKETPSVVLDAQNNTFAFSDTSWPEDAKKFYEPIIQWVENYFKNPNPNTVFEFRMNYFNTSSAKQFAKLLSVIQKYSQTNSVKVVWFYQKDDLDMLKAGNRYAKLLKMNFETVSTDDNFPTDAEDYYV